MSHSLSLSLADRITRIEMASGTAKLPGTQLTRAMAETKGFQWCLAVGFMQQPKVFFYAPTIEDCLLKAEEAYGITDSGNIVLKTEPKPVDDYEFVGKDTGEYVIYCDGACSGNPGPGGWGVYQTNPNGTIGEYYGGEEHTTNNRMELTAVIGALLNLPTGSTVQIYVDSQYVKDGITKYIQNWKRNGWKTAARKPVLNQDLWKKLDEHVERHHVKWNWVKGHSGDTGNDKADKLANMGMAPYKEGK